MNIRAERKGVVKSALAEGLNAIAATFLGLIQRLIGLGQNLLP